MREDEGETEKYNAERVFINVMDDEINAAKKDKNSIYQMLKEDMEADPELAAYVARKMSESLTLEEANLIGDVALVVYAYMHSRSEPKK